MNSQALEYFKSEPVMAELIQRIGPLDFKPERVQPFQSLTRSIVYQQLSGKAAGTILGRFKALFGKKKFPAPEDVLKMKPEKMRASGLSNAKVAYVRALAEKADKGFIPTLAQCDKLTDEELIEKLTEIKGIGRWTVEMMLIFNLGRPDVLSVHDLGIRKGYQIAFNKRGLPEPKSLAKYGKRWAPHRTTASLYLWRAVDTLNK